MLETKRLPELKAITKIVRRNVIEMIYQAGSGHIGGSLSCVDILVALYFEVMKINPQDQRWPKRDRFILSKGHSCPALYAVLAERGFFPKAELANLRKFGSMLQGHPDCKRTPGIEISTGSLGQGFSVAAGMALAAKIRGNKHRVFVLIGDGECDEGIIWEAALEAAHRRLDNLTAITDKNGLQINGTTNKVLNLEPFAEKWAAFGWDVKEVYGHDLAELITVLQSPNLSGKPRMIIANTIKGRGVSYMEGRPEWHAGVPTDEQFQIALKEIDEND